MSGGTRFGTLLGVLTVTLALTVAPGQAQPESTALPPLQVVVLVDESGSLSEADVVSEREVARTIGASTLAPGSVVSVVGFGSSNAPGQSAVNVVCPPVTFDSQQNRNSLATCVGQLHRRTPEEGDGTDHVAALQQALDFVRGTGPEKKLVFLLTDGKLDVSESPAWGNTPERRNGAAAAKVQEVLTELDTAGAQVWPLGFGKVDENALSGFARGKSCTPAAPDPHQQIVPDAAALRSALQNAFSSASCVKYGPQDTDTLPQGGSVDLEVEIPPVASDASILVYKRDQRVQVEYFAPGQTDPAPKRGGSGFEFAGQATETESVRITDPEPGTWTVRLSSADVPTQEVAATVVYQAAVRAYLTVTPPQPTAGQSVDIDMQVWARGKAVTDPGTLQGLSFVTTLTGGQGEPQQVTLTDTDSDGTYSGTVGVPEDASGDLTFTGQVSGIGIGGDTRVLSTTVQDDQAAVRAQILFDTNTAATTPGGSVTGTVSVTNNSGGPVRLRLDVADASPGTTVTVEPASTTAGAGVSDIPFTLRFGAGTTLGPNAATLRLVDEANSEAPVAERLFAITVSPEPTLVEKLFWLWVVLGVALLAVLVFFLTRLRSRRDAARVRGLKARLLRSDFAVAELEPQDPNASVFGFVMHHEFAGLQLQPAGPGEPEVYEVRRAGSTLRLTVPGRGTVTTTAGERHEIDADLVLVLVDERGVPTGPTAAGPVPEAPYDPFAPSGATPHHNGGTGPTDSFGTPPAFLPAGADPFDSGPGPLPPPAPPGDTGADPYNPFR